MLNITKAIAHLLQSAVKTKDVNWMCKGGVGAFTVTAGGYVDQTITFPTACPSQTPHIFAQVLTSSADATHSLYVPIVTARSDTGATIRVINNTSSDASLHLVWYAVD